MSITLLGGLTLAVSLISVTIYMAALGQILIGEHRPGLVRTAACRIVAALLYVWVGLTTLREHAQGPLLGLGVLTAAQFIWWVNAGADVWMTRKARKAVMTDPVFDAGVTAPVASDIPVLSNVVMTSEIDRLSEDQATIKQDISGLRTDVDKSTNARHYGEGALVFSIVVALLGLVFGLVVFNRADNAAALSKENAAIIAQQRDTIKKLTDTQVRLDTTVHEFCGLYGSFTGFYNVKARAVFPQGPDAYDAEFRKLLTSANHLDCGIVSPKDLPPVG
jgi:hypothetical protein